MCLDPDSGAMRHNAIGKETPGSAKRIATKVTKQLLMILDLHSMTKEQMYGLLPAEFRCLAKPKQCALEREQGE